MTRQFCCHKIARGMAEGEALISTDPILFYQTEPTTGIVTERGHCLYGQSVKDKILVFPGGKGSSVVQADGLYKLEREGTKPKGFIIQEPDTVLVATAIIMEIPMVDRVSPDFYLQICNGAQVRLDATGQIIAIL